MQLKKRDSGTDVDRWTIRRGTLEAVLCHCGIFLFRGSRVDQTAVPFKKKEKKVGLRSSASARNLRVEEKSIWSGRGAVFMGNAIHRFDSRMERTGGKTTWPPIKEKKRISQNHQLV